jgi:hypothetical protein
VEAAFIVLAIFLGLGALGSSDSGSRKRGAGAQASRFAMGISLVLFVLAYGLYGADQPLTLRQALTDLVRERLDLAMPLSIVTEWALLCGLWMLFGALHRVPPWRLIGPITRPASTLLGVGWMLLPSVSLALLLAGNPPTVPGTGTKATKAQLLALLHGTGTRQALIPMLVMLALPFGLALLPRRTAAARPASQPARLGQPTSPPTGFRASRGAPLLAMIILVLLIVAIHVVVLTVVIGVRHHLPTSRGVIQVAIAVGVVFILLTLHWFREHVLEPTGQSRTIFAFIDFTLALSALVIAVTGQVKSPVTLGPVPPELIAVALPLLIAAWVFLRGLLPSRTAPAWWWCLLASLAAAIAVYPIKLLLTAALTGPLTHL